MKLLKAMKDWIAVVCIPQLKSCEGEIHKQSNKIQPNKTNCVLASLYSNLINCL